MGSKPHRPPVLLEEGEEQFRWLLKPFSTADDQKTWRERFNNLLEAREKAHSDPDRKEPPCMACYTKVPCLVREIVPLFQEEDNKDEILNPEVLA